MYHEHLDLWKSHLLNGLREDGWPWDWTSLGTSMGKKTARAKIISKSEGIWAGDGLVLSLQKSAATLKVASNIKNGMEFQAGNTLIQVEGDAEEIHSFERPFLNLAAYVCGIATSTSRLVKQVKQACPEETPRVSLTRKTLPGYRDIAIYGVRAGGGFPHRVTLSGGVLIKENHIAVAGSIENAIQGVRFVAPHGLKIEIEVRSISELKEASRAMADGILLDNFTPSQVREAVQWVKSLSQRPVIEISGGLTESNISDFAIPGVQVLSVGSITHSVKSSDFSLLIDA